MRRVGQPKCVNEAGAFFSVAVPLCLSSTGIGAPRNPAVLSGSGPSAELDVRGSVGASRAGAAVAVTHRRRFRSSPPVPRSNCPALCSFATRR